MAYDLLTVLVFSGLFGATMKVADLFDEHGKKWFTGDAVLFGFLWGGLGMLLVFTDMVVGNVLLAFVLSMLIRMKIDYVNHAIGAVGVILAFVYYVIFNPAIFVPFFVVFLIFGVLKDYYGDIRKTRDFWYVLNEIMLYLPVATFVYSAMTGTYIVFAVFTTYMIAYNVIKYFGEKE